ncbi:Sulfur oxidation protein SoxY [Paramagnetospirillum magnetotacticum MS-1]|uniref:Sulfur oxidation protein SoxY n=1 Tax=Paramagnetospirillum magnetotacticum MS-1 TaxID=272627 RepID=A0A0C2YBF7_PARME|nr:thiosulfate oxidation carrier protein SoxY [Paramagnetospirillum magnetotacticum]KIL97064.1 Sulfur oxidation protein SoxY [Paramagnetospirillum magnetotacticum MS-1]
MHRSRTLNRRTVLAGTAAMAAAGLAAPVRAQEAEDLAHKLMGPFKAKEGKVRLKMRDVAASGASEPITVSVDSPMTPADHVKAIHVLAEANPYPVVSSWYLTPLSGRAEVSFRMRLAKTQTVRAYAVTSDGQVWIARQDVTVTIGGCGD